jgi:hypothetical protein
MGAWLLIFRDRFPQSCDILIPVFEDDEEAISAVFLGRVNTILVANGVHACV